MLSNNLWQFLVAWRSPLAHKGYVYDRIFSDDDLDDGIWEELRQQSLNNIKRKKWGDYEDSDDDDGANSDGDDKYVLYQRDSRDPSRSSIREVPRLPSLSDIARKVEEELRKREEDARKGRITQQRRREA
jgi:hypothetical protein